MWEWERPSGGTDPVLGTRGLSGPWRAGDITFNVTVDYAMLVEDVDRGADLL